MYSSAFGMMSFLVYNAISFVMIVDLLDFMLKEAAMRRLLKAACRDRYRKLILCLSRLSIKSDSSVIVLHVQNFFVERI